MARFRYRLQAVLDRYGETERRAKLAHATALAALDAESRALEALGAQKAEALQQLHARASGEACEYQSTAGHAEALDVKRCRQLEALGAASERVAATREALDVAARPKAALERHRERMRAAFDRLRRRCEAAELDEVNTLSIGRNLAGTSPSIDVASPSIVGRSLTIVGNAPSIVPSRSIVGAASPSSAGEELTRHSAGDK